MNRHQIRLSINGAHSAISHIRQTISQTGQENNALRDTSVEIDNGYRGASSEGLEEKIVDYSRDVSNQSNELSNEIRSIQSSISDLERLDRQLEEQERREREERERERRERERRERERRQAASRAGGR